MIESLTIRRKLAILSVVALIFFVLITLDVFFEGALVQFDKVVNHWSLSWHTPLLDRVFYGITQLGNLMAMLFYTVALTLLMLWKKYREGLIFYWSGMIGASLLFSVIKELFMRTRPSSCIGGVHQYGYSFPSGHATMSMTFALLLFFLFYQKVSGAYRVILLFFCLLFPLLVSFSRVYLGVHYFSDVLGGMMLGIFWVTLMAWAFKLKIKS